jgi:hypothetical protein
MENETDRKLDENSTPIGRDRQIAALKREHAFYASRGERAKAEAVAKELARLTGRQDPDAEPVERAVPKTAPERRPAARKTKTKE